MMEPLKTCNGKELANNTTHCRCSPGKGKTTKWKCMIGQRDGDDGMKKKAHLAKTGS